LVVAVKNGPTSTNQVTLTPGLTACSILDAAKAEGKITSVSYTYNGAFVNELNGYVSGHPYYWTFWHNGDFSQVGCRQVPLGANDNVTWRFQ
jgi:hypothetical protein